MKYILVIFASLVLLTTNPLPLLAEDRPDPILISTFEEDITGDGIKELIELKGLLFSPNGGYYHEIWVDITSSQSVSWRIPYQGGYKPEIQFVDLNHDKTVDLYYQSAINETSGLHKYHLHTMKGGKVKEILLPKRNYAKGKFIDDFNVDIVLSPNEKPHVVNVKNRSKDYIQLGIYSKAGKLIKPTSTIFNPISAFEPLLISIGNGYGLKSSQEIHGASNDLLGTINTLWYFENNNWVIVKTDWISH